MSSTSRLPSGNDPAVSINKHISRSNLTKYCGIQVVDLVVDQEVDVCEWIKVLILQIVEVADRPGSSEHLEYDPEWLAILKATDRLQKPSHNFWNPPQDNGLHTRYRPHHNNNHIYMHVVIWLLVKPSFYLHIPVISIFPINSDLFPLVSSGDAIW